MHNLESKVDPGLSSTCDACIHVVDGNALIQSCVSLLETFGEVGLADFPLFGQVTRGALRHRLLS